MGSEMCIRDRFGIFLIKSIDLNTLQLSKVVVAWLVLCASYSLGLWGSVWSCMLLGLGFVGWNSVISTIIGAVTVLIQLIVVFSGGGIVGLAVCAAIGSLLQRFVLIIFARSRVSEILETRANWDSLAVKSMVSPALLAWLTGIGYAVTMHTDQLFIGSLGSTMDIPPYRAAYLIMMNLTLLSIAIAISASVFVSQLWQAGEMDRLRHVVNQSLRISLIIMVCGGACLLALGPTFFDLWLGPGNFVGYPILFVFVITLTLDVQSSTFSTFSRATEDEVFLFCSLAAAFIKVSLALLLGFYYGLLGIALSTLIAQFATCSWYMAYRSIKRLGLSFRGYLRDVATPILILFIITGSVVIAIKILLKAHPPWVSVDSGVTCSGLIMMLALWFLTFDENQKTIIMAKIRKLQSRPKV